MIVMGATALILAGLWVMMMGLRTTPRAVRVRPARRAWKMPKNAARLGIAAACGLVIALFTHFVPAVVLLPALVWVVPIVLSQPARGEVAMLEALDRWVGALHSSQSTGKSIVEAIRSTAHQTPSLLHGPVTRFVHRIEERWTLREAFQAMADELDSADADAVVAALILLGERGGTGASVTLAALSEQTRQRLHTVREIAAEREKPRVVVRQVTIITAVMIGGAILFAPTYFVPLTTPYGQLVTLVLATAYLASLVILQRTATPRRRERILVGSGLVIP